MMEDFFSGSAAAEFADLSGLIKQGVRSEPRPEFILAVDSRVRYGEVKRVVDQVNAAGIRDITFLAE